MSAWGDRPLPTDRTPPSVRSRLFARAEHRSQAALGKLTMPRSTTRVPEMPQYVQPADAPQATATTPGLVLCATNCRPSPAPWPRPR